MALAATVAPVASADPTEAAETGRIQSLSLSPTGLAGVTDGMAWYEPNGGSRQNVVAATEVILTAGRRVYFNFDAKSREKTTIQVSDRGGQRRTLSESKWPNSISASGPYLSWETFWFWETTVGGGEALDVRGRLLAQFSEGTFPGDVYGPLLAVRGGWGTPDDGYLRLLDLRFGKVVFRIPSASYSEMVSGRYLASRDSATGSSVMNRLTSAKASVDGDPYAMSEDVLVTQAVVGEGKPDTIRVYDLRQKWGKKLTPGLTFEVPRWSPVAVNGNRLAYVSPDNAVVVKTLPFGGKEVPVLLGLLDDRTTQSVSKAWKPELDLSKPVKAGQLVIKDSKGAVVTTIATPASADGSLRGLSWDTKDAKGAAVPTGTYTWELKVTDLSGQAAVDVDMVSTPKGTLKVANATTTKPPVKPFDVYTTPGTHDVNGRKWRTHCEKYSVAQRCFTDIYATTVKQVGSKFVQSNGFVFNNLTYTTSPRKVWAKNPLGSTGSWTASDGRQWRTECDTAVTGKGGCRSYIKADVIAAVRDSRGNTRFEWKRGQWIFNNMVRFDK